MLRQSFIIGFFILAMSNPSLADDQSNANRLFVESVKILREARVADVTNAETVRDNIERLNVAQSNLHDIINVYSSSDLAVKYIIDGEVGPLSHEALNKEIERNRELLSGKRKLFASEITFKPGDSQTEYVNFPNHPGRVMRWGIDGGFNMIFSYGDSINVDSSNSVMLAGDSLSLFLLENGTDSLKEPLTVSVFFEYRFSDITMKYHRTENHEAQTNVGDRYLITGNVLDEAHESRVQSWGMKIIKSDEYSANDIAVLEDGTSLTIQEDGTYEWWSDKPFTIERGRRLFIEIEQELEGLQ